MTCVDMSVSPWFFVRAASRGTSFLFFLHPGAERERELRGGRAHTAKKAHTKMTTAALSLVPHAIILCGPGGGSALAPLPGPPALLPIGNEAAVGFLLRALDGAGVRSAILVRFFFSEEKLERVGKKGT